MQSDLETYKKRKAELTIGNMKRDHEAQQWKELTLGID